MAGADVKGQDVSSVKALFLLLKAYIGTGILFLPPTFANGTLTLSIITMILVAILATLGMVMLAYCAIEVPGSFEDIAYRVGGKWSYYCVAFAVAISQYSFALSYTVFLARSIVQLYNIFNPNDLALAIKEKFDSGSALKSASEIENSKTALELFFGTVDYVVSNGGAWAFVLVSVLFPLVLFRKMKLLGDLSYVGIACVSAALIAILVECFSQISGENSRSAEVLAAVPEIRGFAKLFGTSLFAYEGIGLVVPILRSMKNPSAFPRVCCISMAITAALYLFFGIIGLFAYNDKRGVSITLKLNPSELTNKIVNILYIIVIFMTWPLSLAPSLAIMKRAIFGVDSSGKVNNVAKWKHNGLRLGVAASLVLLTFALFNSLGMVLTYSGIILCVPLSFIIPPYIHYKIFGERSKAARYVDIAFMALGVLLLFGVLALEAYFEVNKPEKKGNTFQQKMETLFDADSLKALIAKVTTDVYEATAKFCNDAWRAKVPPADTVETN